MKWKQRNLRELANQICGDRDLLFFKYRSSTYLTEFFQDCGLDYVHDGSTRSIWVQQRLEDVLSMPVAGPNQPPLAFVSIIRSLLDRGDAQHDDSTRSNALAAVNAVLSREGWQAFYDEDGIAQLRHVATNVVATAMNPHRPLTPRESERRMRLSEFLDGCSEDELIERVLLPLFRQLGFHRITAAGHKDKALEYGKDIWMKFTLPTAHVLYFGLQVKIGKLDSAGLSKTGSRNIGEIHNQVNMMLGHEIFDPELNRRVLVDHAFIVSAGEITKQAKNWLGERLDSVKRSQIMFMDKSDILDLFVVANLPLPMGSVVFDDQDIPF